MNGDGENDRVYISLDNERGGFRSQDTSLYSSLNCGEIVDGDCRGGLRYHTRHSSSHNPGNHGRLLRLSVASSFVHGSIHDSGRGDSSGDDGRRGLRSQDTIHSSFVNSVEVVDGDGRGGYRSHTIPFPSHNIGEIGRLLGFSVHGNDRSGNRSHTSQLPSY